MAPKLGIIAGSGTLPRKLVEKCRETGRDCFVLAFEGETDPAVVEGVDHLWSRLGAAGKNFARLREAGVQEIVMAGGVRRPSLTGLRPDWRAAQFFARIGLRALGDDGLLSAVIKELEREGFILVGVDSVLDDAFAHLQVGSRVTYAEEMGDKGAQASTVRLMGKHGMRA